MSSVARAIETGDTRGMIKAIVDEEKDTILGVAVVGQEGRNHVYAAACYDGGITASELKETIFSHPLYAEALNNLFMQL
jgi:pyruvate/2-oxoglutarate dehydrogenase complex dihydrolipoamide dehydrogenase (E3) component